MNSKKKILIICGGPSGERGISLNSARSLFDNLDHQKYEVGLLYFNPKLEAYPISAAQIYSNTPLDFDYKLKHFSKPLSPKKLGKYFKKYDVVFPAIHGTFGEDGKLQKLLEKVKIPYLGSNSNACANTSDKYECQRILGEHGFHTVKSYIAKKGKPLPKLAKGEYVAKPLHGGSSLGVEYIDHPEEVTIKLQKVFEYESEAIIEPRIKGIEFTIIVIENVENQPVAMLPTEIELKKGHFFDYRKKYLSTAETRYHTPARFSQKTTEKIRSAAEKAFTCLGMKDFARIDGWVKSDGTILLSDINAISGMEQNSFLFQQPALFGLSHTQLLDYLINKKIPPKKHQKTKKEEIPVIFGGGTAERQVSVMSGTNVWMKLKSSQKYKPIPHVLTTQNNIYRIPQFLCLQHSVEEIEEKLKLFQKPFFLRNLEKQSEQILARLGIDPKNVEEPVFAPQKTSLNEIAKKYKFLFLGLHGGAGEDGTFQTKLDRLKIPYNGPGAKCSRLCMDKFMTGNRIEKAKIPGVSTAKKMLFPLHKKPEKIWSAVQKAHFAKSIIVKPRADGCSAGIMRIESKKQLAKLLEYYKSKRAYIPAEAIHKGHGQIELPFKKPQEILIENFIQTDKVDLKNLEIHWKPVTDWIEITVGFLGPQKSLTVMPPSQTIASNEILSVEEKFMGGTGINLVPPPSKYVKTAIIQKVQKRLQKVANALGIEVYSRMDLFMNRKTGDLIVIEANTLPALTPSTTFFQQALYLPKSLMPKELLEKIIEIGKKRFQK